MKILVVSTMDKIDEMLSKYINEREIPNAEYTLVQERFGVEALARTIVDNYIPIYDIGDIEEVKNVAKKCEKYGPYDYIIYTDEYSVILCEKLKTFLNFPNCSLVNVIKFRDKEMMKKCIKSVRVPRLYHVNDLKENPSYFPVVIKPKSYAASNGIYIVENYNQLFNIIKQKKLEFIDHNTISEEYLYYEEAEKNDVEIEEYIFGDVYHIDGCVFEGEIIFCSASKYINTCLDFSKGKPMGSIYVSDVNEQKKWKEFAEKINKDMRLTNGVFHLEAFKNIHDERIFLEIAIRPGGGLIVKSTKFAQGVDLNLIHIQSQLGIRPQIPNKKFNIYGYLLISNMILPNDKNIITNVCMPDKLKSVVNMKLPYISDIVEKHNNYNDLIGEFLFQNEEEDIILKDIYSIIEGYNVEVNKIV